MESGNKNWASEYLLDPMHAPDPSQETGPGSSFRPDSVVSVPKSPPSATSSNKLTKNNPFRKSTSSSKDDKDLPVTTTTEIPRRSNTVDSRRSNGYPSPPTSKSESPRSQAFPNFTNSPNSPSHRQEAFSSDSPVGRRRRGSSLNERFPGDTSHRPLDQLTKEKAIADRSRHVTKKHHIQPDTIDSLDNAGGSAYHHSGPYDATLLARNNTRDSPLAALKDSNAETLRATPREKIVDSIQGHRPLDGVAAFAPGSVDPMTGQAYQYRESNMMIDNNPEGGAYKRWNNGMQYHEDDIKGKGEPSYSIEKALKEHRTSESNETKSNGAEGIEMTNRHSRSASGFSRPDSRGGAGTNNMDDALGLGRSGSLSKRLSSGSSGLKKRIGSLRRKIQAED